MVKNGQIFRLISPKRYIFTRVRVFAVLHRCIQIQLNWKLITEKLTTLKK